MRGARRVSGMTVYPMRIIPADAGSTKQDRIPCRRREDHPRGCGEHLRHARTIAVVNGSSPRMRGAPDGNERRTCRYRIIPADAGSTSRHAKCLPISKGSSPRMRGAQIIPTFSMIELRIIPADAGSTIGSCSGR